MKMHFKRIIMMGLLAVNVHGQDFVDVELGQPLHQSCQQVVEIVERDEQTIEAGDVVQEIVILNDAQVQTEDFAQNGDGHSQLRCNIETYCVPFVNAIASGLIVGGILYVITH